MASRDNLLAQLLEETTSGAALAFNPKQCLDAHSKYFDLLTAVRKLEQNISIPKPNRNEETFRQFFDWIDQHIKKAGSEITLHNSQLPSSILSVKKVSEPDNYSLIAKRPTEKGSQIVFVPKSAILSAEALVEDKDMFEFVSNDPIAACMPNIVLVLYLLNEMSKGAKSRWAPYLTILPRTLLPVFKLTKENLRNILHSTHVTEMLRMVRSIARQYSYFYGKLKSSKLPLAKHFTYEYYAWGVSMVCSRQNEIISTLHFSYAGNALVPVLDMCNHDPDSGQAIQTDTFFRIFASKEYKVGEEIKINYGQRSSGDYYIHNGFVPAKIINDSLPLALRLDQQDPFYKTKASLLTHLETGVQSRFVFPRKTDRCNFGKDLKHFLIIYFMTENDIKNMKAFETGPEGFIDRMAIVVFSEEKSTGDKNDEITLRSRACIKAFISRRCEIASAIIDKKVIDDENLQALLRAEQSIYKSYFE